MSLLSSRAELLQRHSKYARKACSPKKSKKSLPRGYLNLEQFLSKYPCIVPYNEEPLKSIGILELQQNINNQTRYVIHLDDQPLYPLKCLPRLKELRVPVLQFDTSDSVHHFRHHLLPHIVQSEYKQLLQESHEVVNLKSYIETKIVHGFTYVFLFPVQNSALNHHFSLIVSKDTMAGGSSLQKYKASLVCPTLTADTRQKVLNALTYWSYHLSIEFLYYGFPLSCYTPGCFFTISLTSFNQLYIRISRKHLKYHKLREVLPSKQDHFKRNNTCLLYTSPSPRDA